jgi:hypothetical protein
MFHRPCLHYRTVVTSILQVGLIKWSYCRDKDGLREIQQLRIQCSIVGNGEMYNNVVWGQLITKSKRKLVEN